MTATAVRPLAPATRSQARHSASLAAAAVAVLALAAASMFVGVSDVPLPALLSGDPATAEIFWISRVPRTLAVLLAGMAVAVAGLIMQLMARNRFVEPSTVGTVESATLGILVVTVFAPQAPVPARMLVASGFALLGTALFLAILRRLPARNTLLIPLVGIMLGGVIAAVTT
ncbi:MAG: transport system permease protein, partial [Pseudarthrobacter sp.]|nr:transport system permease protein [Pseudarthrobacter sp.]